MTGSAGAQAALDALSCTLAGRCGGCSEHARSLEQQRSAKHAQLVALMRASGVTADCIAAARLVTPAALAFREHLDLRWDGQRLGLIGTESAPRGDEVGAPKVVVDMVACPLVVPSLAAWLGEVRSHPLPIARASARLRVGVERRRGIWIDCAHADVKALLDEGTWLTTLASLTPPVVIELGPKARRVMVHEGRVSLVDSPLEPWSQTFAGARALSLYTSVRAFSQPGAAPNRVLVQAVSDAVLDTYGKRVLELGAGAGNLTLPLLAAGLTVRAVELDGAALARSADEAGLAARLEISASSFERGEDIATLVQGVDVMLADPPRQGLGRFIDGLARLSRGLRPLHLVYVSCHPEALARDSARLAALGYALTHLSGVDQFPWTPHAEWVATFNRA